MDLRRGILERRLKLGKRLGNMQDGGNVWCGGMKGFNKNERIIYGSAIRKRNLRL